MIVLTETASFLGHKAKLNGLLPSSDGKYLFTGSEDKTVRKWDAATGRQLWSTHIVSRFDFNNDVWALAPSRDPRILYVGVNDGSVRALDTQTGTELKKFTLGLSSIRSIVSSADGKKLFVGSYGGDSRSTLEVIDLETGQLIPQIFTPAQTPLSKNPLTSPVWSMAASPDGKFLFTGHDDGTARQWNLESGREIHLFPSQSDTHDPVRTLVLSPDGTSLFTGNTYSNSPNTVRKWHLQTGQLAWQFGMNILEHALTINNDGRLLFVVGGLESSHGAINVIDADSGRQIGRYIRSGNNHSGSPYFVSISPDSKSIFIANTDMSAAKADDPSAH